MGAKLGLEIEVDGKPTKVQWLKDGKPIVVPNLKEEDFGRYSVVVSNDAGQAESGAAVTEAEEKPEIVSGLKPAEVKPGETAQFEVQTKGPVKAVKWYKNGKRWTTRRQKNRMLLIPPQNPNSQKDDQAEYKVVLSNSAGQADSSAALTVKVPSAGIGLSNPAGPDSQKEGQGSA
uniref:Ig-like domain-containing protein n=1 Tax=Ditylenchus dipsaci TaxID=166011 RepID=A0A915E3Y7_9BILA